MTDVYKTNKNNPIERDGVRFKVDFVNDTHPDTSFIGEFSDTWEPGAIDRATWYYDPNYGWQPFPQYTRWPNRECRWFIPSCGPDEVEAERAAWSRAGESRGQAYLKASRIPLRQYELMKTLGTGWWFMGIVVTAYVDGFEVAQASLWGIEDGWLPNSDRQATTDYHETVTEELIDDCIAQLPRTAIELQNVVNQLEEVLA